MHCAYCQKRIFRKKRNIFVNIEQNPKKIFFCSKKCKLAWIFRKQKAVAKIFKIFK